MDELKLVADIMSKPVHHLSKEDRLSYAKSLFEKYQIQHLPVVEDKKVIGMVSLHDLFRVSLSDEFIHSKLSETVLDNVLPIEDMMIKNIVTVNANDTVSFACELLYKHDFHALPVVSHDDEIVGMVTTKDLINCLQSILNKQEKTPLT